MRMSKPKKWHRKLAGQRGCQSWHGAFAITSAAFEKDACRIHLGREKTLQNFANITVMNHYFIIKGFLCKRDGIYLFA